MCVCVCVCVYACVRAFVRVWASPAYIYETSQDQMRLKSETFISSYRQKMTWESFSGRFWGFAYTNSKFIQL